MAVGIFCVFLALMAAFDMNQQLSSEESGNVRKSREEILQRMKEQEASLRLLHWRLKKEIAALEASQKTETKFPFGMEGKIQKYLYKVLFLAAIMLFKLWGLHLQEVTCQHSGEETDMVFLRKARKGMALPDKTLCVW